MRVDIWSDIVCPWCYIGDARFSRALADFEHSDEVEVVHRSFALGNTFDAHRLVHFGREQGVQQRVANELYRAYFGEGRSVFDTDALAGLPAGAGLDPDGARRELENGSFSDDVRADEQEAGRLGINGVPFCVLGGKYGVSGAQPGQTFAQALRQAWDSLSGT
jgi:predicted DsbA family dithiol-disulfide isomerase